MGQLLIFLYVLLWLTHGSLIQRASASACKESERSALLKLKRGITNEPAAATNPFTSWTPDQEKDCCKWRGVECNNLTGDVVRLNLGTNCVWGFSVKQNSSTLDLALTKLTRLQHLDLSCHQFDGSPLPRFIGSMNQLRHLNLSHTKFMGELPSQLGKLTLLQTLDLNYAYSYPVTMRSHNLDWLSSLSELKYLDLSGINLSQALDSMNVFLKIPSLLQLRLSDCQLTIDHISRALSTTVPVSSKLQLLDVSSNSLPGPIPQFIANLTFLQSLDLSGNSFTGFVPSWLSNKKSLQRLDLSVNWLTDVQGGFWVMIRQLCSLRKLDLSFNLFQGPMLEESSLGNLSGCAKYNLQELNLATNHINGSISSWLGELKGLTSLNLGFNSFSGNIPVSLGKLSLLRLLDLSNNRLYGVVNEEFLSNLTGLYHLDFIGNSLTLEVGSDWVPLFHLEYLGLGSCKIINGSFPKWILSQKKMVNLNVSATGLLGSVPEKIGEVMPSLISLYMDNNDLSGSIPVSLCNPKRILVLDLHRNRLSGPIPDCWEPASLTIINLSSNQLSGSIPKSLAKVTGLWLVRLNNNSLEGDMSMLWRNFTDLRILDLGENKLTGSLAPWNQKENPELQIIRLRGNQISGSIPPQLCSLPHLQIIDLAHNNITGHIPPCLGNLTTMINIGETEFWVLASAVEVLKGEVREYTTNTRLLVNMDLSSNHFRGSIPLELTKLSALIGLNLSNNHLEGPIPTKIGEMRALESLDLSRNSLSGTIPQSLSALTSLSYMNLSNNDLEGRIPTGSQLQVLDDPSIYRGNSRLCGNPLRKCPGDLVDTDSSTDKESRLQGGGEGKQEELWFYFSVLVGLASGFWGVIVTLIAKKKLRSAYFRIADGFAEQIDTKITAWSH